MDLEPDYVREKARAVYENGYVKPPSMTKMAVWMREKKARKAATQKPLPGTRSVRRLPGEAEQLTAR